MTVTGVSGEVRWGYLPAARLRTWTLVRKDGQGTVTARVESVDEYRVGQAPLVLVVPAGSATWRWTLEDVQISGDTLTASVR